MITGNTTDRITVVMDVSMIEHFQALADAEGMKISPYIRGVLLDMCPATVREACRPQKALKATTAPKPAIRVPVTAAGQPLPVHKPLDRGASFEDKKRAILAMAGDGLAYSAGYISTRLKLPYRLVHDVIADAKKGRPK